MNRLAKVVHKTGKIVEVSFTDGFTSTFDVSPFIKGGISEQLRDPEFFKQLYIDDFGGLSWSNGFDFCPNFLRQYLQKRIQEMS